MRTRSPHKLLFGLLAVMTLSSGCAADQLQRFRETVDVALETTRKAMEAVEEGAKTVECVKNNTCPKREE